MFQLDLILTLRRLARERMFTLLNVIGLGLSLMAVSFAWLYVDWETSFENWLPNVDRIYRIETTFTMPGSRPQGYVLSPGPMAAALEKDFGSDIEAIARYYRDDFIWRYEDKTLTQYVTFADKDFLEILDLNIIEGDREAVFRDSRSILLTQSVAQRFFGDEPALGKLVDFAGISFRVVAIAAITVTTRALKAAHALPIGSIRHE